MVSQKWPGEAMAAHGRGLKHAIESHMEKQMPLMNGATPSKKQNRRLQGARRVREASQNNECSMGRRCAAAVRAISQAQDAGPSLRALRI
ncbi:MAG: hypothetical protein B7Z37_12295 [Verrucomicrobia bacterium 12-59-8]|nr:MAG: hypothetical protein B7Z37_12295 [Verrucomicrobia bacterium 12-59-8]